MRQKFNLKKALAGHKLITRDGRSATNFRKSFDYKPYTYAATIDGTERTYTDEGKFQISADSNYDLFLDTTSSTFTKSDLKDFMRVRYRDGRMRIVALSTPIPKLVSEDGTLELDNYDNDLKYTFETNEFDIIEVYEAPIWNILNPNKYGDLIWRRNTNTISKDKAEKLLEEKTGIKYKIIY